MGRYGPRYSLTSVVSSVSDDSGRGGDEDLRLKQWDRNMGPDPEWDFSQKVTRVQTTVSRMPLLIHFLGRVVDPRPCYLLKRKN